jgi:hypothetical protein
MTGLAPAGDGFFNEPSFRIMLRKELGLAVHQLGGMCCERFGDPRVQLLPRAAQQAAMRRVLNQGVLEGVDRVGRGTSLEHQLGGDEAGESGLQLVLGEAADSLQQRVRKFSSDGGARLRH